MFCINFSSCSSELEGSAVQMVEMYCKNLPLSKDLDSQESMHGEELLSLACNVLIQVCVSSLICYLNRAFFLGCVYLNPFSVCKFYFSVDIYYSIDASPRLISLFGLVILAHQACRLLCWGNYVVGVWLDHSKVSALLFFFMLFFAYAWLCLNR